jgi:hypothetical protein
MKRIVEQKACGCLVNSNPFVLIRAPPAYVCFEQSAAATSNHGVRDTCTIFAVVRNPMKPNLHIETRNHVRAYPQGGPRDARRPKRCHRHDRFLVAAEEPPLGSHLVTPRRGFSHHGIYVGGGTVIHYHSAICGFSRGPVEEVSLARFSLGHAICVRIHATPQFDGAEVARRARSRVGENRYRLLSNNCEHYCEWCLQDEPRSYQVERWLSLPRQLARVFRDAAIALLPAGSGVFGSRTLRRSDVIQQE